MRFIVILTVFMCSCGSSNDDLVRQQCIEVHRQLLIEALEVENNLKNSDSILFLKYDLTDMSYRDSVKQIKQDLAKWESMVVEVPGFDHDGHEGHHHHHEKAPEITPEMMLEVQKKLLDQVQEINIRATYIFSTIRDQD